MPEEWPKVRPLSPPFEHVGGAQWVAALPDDVGEPDGVYHHRQSRLVLFEDGEALGPAHVNHVDIAALGGGRYSHWRDGLRFSTRDCTDPNTNGRTYAFSLSSQQPAVLTIGSCHIHRAVEVLGERQAILPLVPTYTAVNNTREQRQVLERCLQDCDDPGALAALCALPAERPLHERRAFLEEADAVVVDIGAPLTFELDGWQLNAGAIVEKLVEPAQAINERMRHLAGRWYIQGLLQQRDDIRIECGAAMLEAAPNAPAWARSAISGTRVRRQSMKEVADDLRWIQSIVGKPMILASMPIRFTQRGTAVTYTPNFFASVTRLGNELSVPVIHPHELLKSLGLSISVRADRQHMTDIGAQAYADALLQLLRAL